MVADASTKTYGSSKMSEFFRHGSVEEKRAVYSAVAIVAIVAIVALALGFLHLNGRPDPRYIRILNGGIACEFLSEL